jgi:hypothetical protein
MTDQTERRQELLANQLERLSDLEQLYHDRIPLEIKQEIEELKLEITRITTALGERNVTPTMIVARDINISPEDVQTNTGMGSQAQIGRMIGRDAISVGEISGAGVAIGRGTKAAFNVNRSQLEMPGGDLAQLFAPLAREVRDNMTALVKVNALREELARGENASDAKMAGLIEDIAEAVPDAIEIIDNIFAHPTIAKTSGATTKFVLRHMRRS